MNYLPRMLQKLKKMRYFRNFCFLLSKNLRLAQNLPNEVFVYKSDFKVDIPHTETISLVFSFYCLSNDRTRTCLPCLKKIWI